MSIRSGCIVAAWVLALSLWVTGVAAQERFGVVAQNAVAPVSGLRIVTIRDNQRAECYTLFILEPPAGAAVAPVPALDDEVTESVRRVREAAENRDRQLADLKARTAKRPAFPLDSAEPARWYEIERRKIDEQYEQVLRAETAATYPWASSFPGTRSGGWEDSANAIRRGVVDPDPTSTMKTMMDHLVRIDELLRKLADAPRLAASGPNRCEESATVP